MGDMPRAPGIPVIGSAPQVALQQFEFFDAARERCGSLFQVDFGVTSVVMVADPNIAQEVWVERAKHFDKGEDFWDSLREFLGNGLPMSDGEVWRRSRRLMNPEFRRARIAGFAETIREGVAEGIEELEGPAGRGETIEISEWTAKLLSILTVRILFGAEFDTSRMDSIRAALTVLLDNTLSGMVTRKLPDWVPVPGAGDLETAKQTIDSVVMDLIAERRKNPGESKDLLGMLIEATQGEADFPDHQLRDEAISVYLAGYETTAWTLAWAIWLLADHPGIVRELQDEVDEIDEPMRCPLLGATIDEVMRLYPSAPFLPRRATVDEELGGYPIPKGTTVVLSPWLIHRNPDVWPNPKRFDPRRHLGEHPERPKLALVPFGAGKRICIGKGLAKLEAHSTLHALLRKFTPRPGAGPRSRPALSTTLRSRDGISCPSRPPPLLTGTIAACPASLPSCSPPPACSPAGPTRPRPSIPAPPRTPSQPSP